LESGIQNFQRAEHKSLWKIGLGYGRGKEGKEKLNGEDGWDP
jgi:hypothetical protein